MAPLVSGAPVLNQDFLATPNFTQADLTGTWDMQLLRTGSQNKWVRARVAVDASGNATCVSMSNSTDATVCPAPADFDLHFAINSAGVITQTGDNAAEVGNHMTMTPNGNFMAGTGTTNSSYQLSIAQKVPSWALPESLLVGKNDVVLGYNNSDLASKTFVFHGLSVGGVNGWAYGTGTTNASRVLSFSPPTVSDLSVVTLPGGLAVSVDINGIVTIGAPASGPSVASGVGPASPAVPSISNFQGFLSEDRKTIVGTFTTGTSYQLIIIQITGSTVSPVNINPAAVATPSYLPAGISAAHMLAAGSAPFWAHSTLTVGSLGAMTLSEWSASNGMAAPSTAGLVGYMTPMPGGGVITGVLVASSYHGQMSYDEYFTVGTATLADGVYSLIVTTSTVPVAIY